VVGGSDLGECKWLGDVRFVTADAEHSGVEFLGVDRARVVDMFGERTVAGLAVDVDVPAALLFFQDIRMAVFAGLVTGVIHGTSGDFGWGIATVVSILSEALGHQESTHSTKAKPPMTKTAASRKRCPASLKVFIKTQPFRYNI